MFIRKLIAAVVFVLLMSLSVANVSLADAPELAPGDKIPPVGGVALIPLSDNESDIRIMPIEIGIDGYGDEDGSWSMHAAKNVNVNDRNPNFVHWANDNGCNDAWVGWNNVSAYEAMNLGVWATDWVNQQHINAHNGLDGYASCVGNNCTVRLCTKHGLSGGGANAWTVDLELP